MLRCALVVSGLCLTGCGDNAPPTCEVPETPLPAVGDFIDPYELPLEGCVGAGLRDVGGRWFVRDPMQRFEFDYPRIDGTCSTGFTRVGSEPVDHDLEDDGRTRHTWSDGTRYFERTEERYVVNGGDSTITFVEVRVMCMVSPDQLVGAAVSLFRFGEDQPYIEQHNTIGTRFARKDELAKGLELVGELGKTPDGEVIYAVNLVIDDGFAYVSAFTGFEIVDVSDPATPVLVGHLDGSYNDVRVTAAGDKRYAILAPAGSGGGTSIIDVTTPTEPREVTTIDSFSHSLQLQLRGARTELYLADYTDRVPIYDITNPELPILLGNARVPGADGEVHDLTVDGDVIYANYTQTGFVAFDLSTGFATPSKLGNIATSYSHASWRGSAGGRPILLHGDEGLTTTADGAAFLRVLDGEVGSTTFMAELGRYQTRPEVGIHNIEMHGSRVYIAYYQDGVRIVDIADPAKPVEVAHYNTWDAVSAPGAGFEGALGIRKVGDLIYVADNLRGLVILREK